MASGMKDMLDDHQGDARENSHGFIHPPSVTEDEQPNEPGEQRNATRRSFLRSVGRKTLYVTPVLMTLAAQEARAASPSNPSV